jgi:hypothetical protein
MVRNPLTVAPRLPSSRRLEGLCQPLAADLKTAGPRYTLVNDP